MCVHNNLEQICLITFVWFSLFFVHQFFMNYVSLYRVPHLLSFSKNSTANESLSTSLQYFNGNSFTNNFNSIVFITNVVFIVYKTVFIINIIFERGFDHKAEAIFIRLYYSLSLSLSFLRHHPDRSLHAPTLLSPRRVACNRYPH